MSWFDWVPTPVEVFEWAACHLTDHDYQIDQKRNEWVCSCCGKVKDE